MNPNNDAASNSDEVESEHLEESERDGNEAEAEAGDGDDLFNENFLEDYRAIPELDRYEEEGMELADITENLSLEDAAEARRRAEAEMDARDRVQHQRNIYEPELMDIENEVRSVRRRRVQQPQGETEFNDEDEVGNRLLAEFKESQTQLAEWIQHERVKYELDHLFRRFIRNYREPPETTPVYIARIRDMITYSKTSLLVDFTHLANFSEVLYHWTVLQPKPMFEIFNKAAYELVCERQSNFSTLWSNEVYVRLENIPMTDTLRSLNKSSLEMLINIKGVVTRRTAVFPQLKQVMYDCSRCGNAVGPFFVNDDVEFRLDSCPNCRSKGGMSVNARQTIYGNYQKLTLQESPGDVPPGMVPRQKEVVLQQDLIDSARPGDEVMVCGVFTYAFDASLNKKCGFPLFRTTIEANNVTRQDHLSSLLQLTDFEREEILRLSKDPRIGERIFKSIAPSIHGHEYIKMAIAMALFGGNEKRSSVSHTRGDINILLLGDPGTGKSQFLKYAQKTAQRSIYSNGKGASAVGLTAAVHKDPITREWTLEGGALVLADRGICLIDEFDKMNDQDRVSIHEAMEQQSISISKAGIITQLQARCAVIAAANPIGGKYDLRLPFRQNVLLEDPIISRFDCLCVVRDVVNHEVDTKLTKFLLNVHLRSHPDDTDRADEVATAYEATKNEEAMDMDEEPPSATVEDPDLIPQDLLRKYIIYAKTCAAANLFDPSTQNGKDELEEYILAVYQELRRESCTFDGVSITVRHLESMLRMSEAHARMHLRERVTFEDTDFAVRMMVETFIQTQKFSVQRGLRRKLQKYLNCGKPTDAVMVKTLEEMIQNVVEDFRLKGRAVPNVVSVSRRDIERKAKNLDIDVESFLKGQVFQGSGLKYDEQTHVVFKEL